MPKFKRLAEHLQQLGLLTEHNRHAPTGPVSRNDLLTCHTPEYIEAFTQGRLSEREIKKAGLPWSPALVQRSLLAVAGTVLTAELALRHGLSCHAAGGTHHAHPGHASGFCLLNDLAVAARVTQQRHHLDTVLILDLDVHQGDGSAVIFQNDPTVFTASFHCAKNFPLRKPPSDYDVALPPGMGDADYIAALEDHLPMLLDRVQPDLVLYDAGADVHQDDVLGHLCLTDAGVMARDRYVIQQCRERGHPTACVIGGGYDKDLARLARRHSLLHRAAHAVQSETTDASPIR